MTNSFYDNSFPEVFNDYFLKFDTMNNKDICKEGIDIDFSVARRRLLLLDGLNDNYD